MTDTANTPAGGPATDLRPALADALEGLQEMLPYVPAYFVEKWALGNYIDRARAALAIPGATARRAGPAETASGSGPDGSLEVTWSISASGWIRPVTLTARRDRDGHWTLHLPPAAAAAAGLTA
jgi:hypothetical protein